MAARGLVGEAQRDGNQEVLYERIVRVVLIVMLLACSKPSPKEGDHGSGSGFARESAVAPAANRFPARQQKPADDELAEEWTREIADPHDRDVFGVGAVKLRSGNGQWQVTVYVMEFIRDIPLEDTLRTRIPAALSSVPGVVEVREDDREVWGVHGAPSGSALVDAVAHVVDELAPRARDEITRQLSK